MKKRRKKVLNKRDGGGGECRLHGGGKGRVRTVLFVAIRQADGSHTKRSSLGASRGWCFLVRVRYPTEPHCNGLHRHVYRTTSSGYKKQPRRHSINTIQVKSSGTRAAGAFHAAAFVTVLWYACVRCSAGEKTTITFPSRVQTSNTLRRA